MGRLIPTYEKGTWSESSFETDEDFASFLKDIFKEPGQYNFDETAYVFNEQARIFNKKVFIVINLLDLKTL